MADLALCLRTWLSSTWGPPLRLCSGAGRRFWHAPAHDPDADNACLQSEQRRLLLLASARARLYAGLPQFAPAMATSRLQVAGDYTAAATADHLLRRQHAFFRAAFDSSALARQASQDEQHANLAAFEQACLREDWRSLRGRIADHFASKQVRPAAATVLTAAWCSTAWLPKTRAGCMLVAWSVHASGGPAQVSEWLI
jgi:hypothetical protein